MTISPEVRFYSRAKSAIALDSDLPDFFVYYLTIEAGANAATVQLVKYCYAACDLAPPSWLAPHFSNGLKSKPKRFIKQNGGYRLENRRRETIANLLGDNRTAIETTVSLSKLEAGIESGPERDFLHETINCFGVGANRAAVVMCWNLVLHHLQNHVISDAKRLASFNASLALNTDKRVKINSIAKLDDFSEMPENKFLLFCRESKIITSSLFKKLEGCLDERNGAAHPSGLKVTPKFAEAYIEDLVENVLKKFAA